MYGHTSVHTLPPLLFQRSGSSSMSVSGLSPLSRGQSVGLIHCHSRSPSATPPLGGSHAMGSGGSGYQLRSPPLPSREGARLRRHRGEGKLSTCAKFQQKRRCFPPVSLPPGSSYPREEVRDSHGGGHLAAPLHPSVFAQCDVGASVQVRLIGIVVVGQEGLSELTLFLEAGLWREWTKGRASVMNEAQQTSGPSPPQIG